MPVPREKRGLPQLSLRTSFLRDSERPPLTPVIRAFLPRRSALFSRGNPRLSPAEIRDFLPRKSAPFSRGNPRFSPADLAWLADQAEATGTHSPRNIGSSRQFRP